MELAPYGAFKPATEGSSSSSGQCKLIPHLPISHRARCSRVAFLRTGNHTSGTLRMRPSVNDTRLIALSNSTTLASVVTGA